MPKNYIKIIAIILLIIGTPFVFVMLTRKPVEENSGRNFEQPSIIEKATTTRTKRIVKYLEEELKTTFKQEGDKYSTTLENEVELIITNQEDPTKYEILFNQKNTESSKKAGTVLGYILAQTDLTDEQITEIAIGLPFDSAFGKTEVYEKGSWEFKHEIQDKNAFVITKK